MKPTLLEAKHVQESVVLVFPFATEIPAGVTIGSVQRVVTLKRGSADNNPSAILVGAAVVQSAEHEVWQRVAGGVGGAVYGILMVATLSDGSTVLVRGVELPVVSF
jgi:hypothetical protein